MSRQRQTTADNRRQQQTKAAAIRLLLSAVACSCLPLSAASSQDRATRAVVLIVSDGLRWQEVFTGADTMGFDMSIFRVDPPVYEEILAVRAERQRLVTDFLATATTELLAEEREDPWGGGDWRPSVGDCIRVILEEEWAHLRYLRRDLARMR